MSKYDVAVFIARVQPPHLAHVQIVEHALNLADHLIVVLGAFRSSPDIRNPWTAADREQMLRSCLSQEQQNRVRFVAVRDQPYNDIRWAADVHEKVRAQIFDVCDDESPTVCLVGHKKDATSFYLDTFPQWTYADVGSLREGMSATEIRERYFSLGKNGNAGGWVDREWTSAVSPGVRNFLDHFRKTKTFDDLFAEWQYVQQYKRQWSVAPHPPTFVTTDCVVVKSGHVLVIRRAHNPGAGQIALPGGFLDQDRTLEESALRELKEETRIKVDVKVLRVHMRKSRVFAHPERSARGRTITHAFYIKLPDSGVLPEVRADSDAAGAFWMPIGDVRRFEDEFFEDHLDIIETFLNR